MEYKLSNPILINNISQQLKNFEQIISKEKDLIVDLSDIVEVDSAGISLLLEFKQQALVKNCKLSLKNPTDAVINLTKLYKINF